MQTTSIVELGSDLTWLSKGAFINYERGGGMGDLRGDLKIFYTEKGGT